VFPVPSAIVELADRHRLVVTVEDGGGHGGFGSAVAAALRDAELDVPLRTVALPQEFLDHGARADLLATFGLTAQDVARRVTEWAAALPADPAVLSPETGTATATDTEQSMERPRRD
jgi:1-deoxy-D-xylulose-5-phosphate synthase